MSLQIYLFTFMYVFIYLFALFYFIVYATIAVPFFPLSLPSSLPSPLPQSIPTHLLFMSMGLTGVLCLVSSPSSTSPHGPLPSYSCQSVPWFCASNSILLINFFCSLNSSYKWDHMVFSFIDWLISFSIIVSSSIHAGAKGKNFFLIAV